MVVIVVADIKSKDSSFKMGKLLYESVNEDKEKGKKKKERKIRLFKCVFFLCGCKGHVEWPKLETS